MKDTVAERVSALIERSGKPLREIAEEMGYDKPNIISMFATGAARVPIRRLASLARALNADPCHLVRMGLEEYCPEDYRTIAEHVGEVLSENERDILFAIRRVYRNGDPKLSEAQERDLVLMFATSPS